MILYPGYLAIAEKNSEFSPDIPVTASIPPAFIVQAEDDPVHVENAVDYFMALKKAGVPAELHIYAQGRPWVRTAPDGDARDAMAPAGDRVAAYD